MLWKLPRLGLQLFAWLLMGISFCETQASPDRVFRRNHEVFPIFVVYKIWIYERGHSEVTDGGISIVLYLLEEVDPLIVYLQSFIIVTHLCVFVKIIVT